MTDGCTHPEWSGIEGSVLGVPCVHMLEQMTRTIVKQLVTHVRYSASLSLFVFIFPCLDLQWSGAR